MKSKYRNVLIGTAIAAALGITGAAYAHGNSYGGNGQQGAQAQQGCGGTGPAMGMGGHGMDMMGVMMGSGNMMNMMGDHGMGMMGSGGMQGGMGRGFGFDLSEEQKTEMGKIREEMLPMMGELRGKMQANHEQLRALRQSGSMDQATITKLADQKGELIAEMIKMRSQHQARMKALLTEEQREQMHQRRQGMGMKGMQQQDG